MAMDTPASKTAARPVSPEEMVNDALDTIERLSIQKTKPDGSPFLWAHAPEKPVDWKQLRQTALDELYSVSTPTDIDVCGVIDRAILRLHDGHSMIFHPDYRRTIKPEEVETVSWPEQKERMDTVRRNNGFKTFPPQPMPTVEYVGNGDVLHVVVPGFMADATGPLRKEFEDKIRDALLKASGENIRAVVVDLRENAGGSMCPMISGLSPLLGPGTLGFFAKPDRMEKRDINYGPPGFEIDPANAANFPLTNIPVAVLCSRITCSSGEITYQSLSGRPNTRSFGEPTDGSASGNASGPVRGMQNLTICICSSIAQDRNGKGDGGPLRPDVLTDKPLEDALQWIADGALTPKSDRSGRKPSPSSFLTPR
ncbi:MAG: S41 family peptidase [Alphaproteobacteria bacterium]